MTATDTTAVYEKLEELAKRMAEMNEKLSVHIAREDVYITDFKDKLDGHLQEHKDAASTWRKGVIGAVFTILGSLIVWAASFIWSHKA